MTASHTLDRLRAAFDDPNLVANAGQLLPGTLAQHVGLPELIDECVQLGMVDGAANPGEKAMTVIASALAGGDCINDVDVLRSGASDQVVGHRVAAPSTVGTFLRAFTWGHVRQLDHVSGKLLTRAWTAGAGPGSDPLTIDIDSTICETYGTQKQGGSRFTYTKVRGYHPLLATVSGIGDVVHARLRGGSSNTGRGAESFVIETIRRLRKAGASGQITLRADSGLYNKKVVKACQKNGARFSITVRMCPSWHKKIESLDDKAWTPIPYWLDGAADVAETTYTPFGKRGTPLRLIVRRVEPTPGSQLALKRLSYTYHAFITDRVGDTLELEAGHRRHAEVENTVRDLKYGVGLNHMPSGRFPANGAWLACNVMAHNLARWVTRLGLKEKLLATDTLRKRYLAMPGRMASSGRRLDLHLPEAWLWAESFLAALGRLRSI